MARFLLIGLFTLAAAPAFGQGVDWKPAITYGTLAAADVVSTHRFLSNGGGCVEGNDRYWGHDGFTPARPDTARMWREKAIATAAAAGLTWAASKMRHTPARRIAKGLIYAGAARFGYAAARNVARCGW